mgnify:CR=1 FL=1
MTTSTFIKIPFDIEHWRKEGIKRYPHGLPRAYSNDPRQWIFHGHPCALLTWNATKGQCEEVSPRQDSQVIQIAVLRLLGYRWPSESLLAENLDPMQNILIHRSRQLATVRLESGIFPLYPGEQRRAALDDLKKVIELSYSDCNEESQNPFRAKSRSELYSYLQNEFFIEHCKLFLKRPFIWHLWDGEKDGFSVLLNYHDLDAQKLQMLLTEYLEPWCQRQKKKGAIRKYTAAVRFKHELEAIQKGEEPYDIFVRWKRLAEQCIGWNPDQKDGVRLNIRPFVLAKDSKYKGAGLFRSWSKGMISWKTDRGKEEVENDFFSAFNGKRVNQHHLSLRIKQKVKSARTE